MKDLLTITEFQLLFLARQELSRRIDELKDSLIKGNPKRSRRRTELLLTMYCDQIGEITRRMAQINRENEQ